MNIFYITDSGSTGRDLNSSQQPVFVLGGLQVTEESYGKTLNEYQKILKTYFRGNIPPEFELHVENLLSPIGKGFFETWDREKRNNLVFDIIEMCFTLNNRIFLHAIDKKQLRESITGSQGENEKKSVPYLLAYEYMITYINWYIKTGLQGIERGMAILERSEELEKDIKAITRYKKYNAKGQNQIKHLVEISYALDSEYNPLMQISELICFITKKYFEIEQGYRENYPEDAKSFFKEGYLEINKMIINCNNFALEHKGDLDFYKSALEINLIRKPIL